MIRPAHLVLGLAMILSAAGGCRAASSPNSEGAAPTTVSGRARGLLLEDARAIGRIRVAELRAHLSQARIDELGEAILSRRFRLPVDISREVDEILFAAYRYDVPDAVALLYGRFRAAELREALAKEATVPQGTATEAPAVGGERSYRVGQGDLYVAGDDLIVVGSRAGMERLLRRVTSAPALRRFPLEVDANTLAQLRAWGPRSGEELPQVLRRQPLAAGFGEAQATLSRDGEVLVANATVRFADAELAREAHARVLPFARLVPTWTRGALPAAEVSVDGATVEVRERIDPSKLEVLVGSATSLVSPVGR